MTEGRGRTGVVTEGREEGRDRREAFIATQRPHTAVSSLVTALLFRALRSFLCMAPTHRPSPRFVSGTLPSSLPLLPPPSGTLPSSLPLAPGRTSTSRSAHPAGAALASPPRRRHPHACCHPHPHRDPADAVHLRPPGMPGRDHRGWCKNLWVSWGERRMMGERGVLRSGGVRRAEVVRGGGRRGQSMHSLIWRDGNHIQVSRRGRSLTGRDGRPVGGSIEGEDVLSQSHPSPPPRRLSPTTTTVMSSSRPFFLMAECTAMLAAWPAGILRICARG